MTSRAKTAPPYVSAKKRFYIAPSILSANFTRLEDEINQTIEAGCEWIHLDIMDGHFVPNISFGPQVVRCIRKAFPSLFLDAHLMIEEPFRYLKAFVDAGANLVTVHAETCGDVQDAVRKIHKAGIYAGLSIKPKTSIRILSPVLKDVDLILMMSVEPGFGGQKIIPSTLNKVRRLSLKKKKFGYSFTIEIDGGINVESAPIAYAAGAEVLVAGSAVFHDGEAAANITALSGSILHASP